MQVFFSKEDLVRRIQKLQEPTAILCSFQQPPKVYKVTKTARAIDETELRKLVNGLGYQDVESKELQIISLVKWKPSMDYPVFINSSRLPYPDLSATNGYLVPYESKYIPPPPGSPYAHIHGQGGGVSYYWNNMEIFSTVAKMVEEGELDAILAKGNFYEKASDGFQYDE